MPNFQVYSIIGPKPYWRIWISALVFLWFPLPLIGFNSHHDGYVFTAARLTRDAMLQGGDWPFNQFGSFWVFPQALLGFFIPDKYLFVGTRYLTLAIYFFTGYLLWKLAKGIKDKEFANLSLFLFFASQPFVGVHASGFNSWPSAVAMPIVLLIGILVIGTGSRKVSLRRTRIDMFAAGALVVALILTRVQVGLLTLVACIFFIAIIKKLEGLLFYLSGIFSFTFFYFLYLASNGWALDSLKDEFVFGSVYVRAGASIFQLPIPIYTLIGTALLLLLFIFHNRFQICLKYVLQSHPRRILLSITVLAGLLTVYLVLDSRNLGLVAIISVSARRFWMSLLFACLLFFLFKQVRLNLRAKRMGTLQEFSLQRDNFLLLLSIAAQSQVWPLFDQMHSWWGSVPGILFVSKVLISTTREFPVQYVKGRTFPMAIATIFTVLIVQWVPQVGEIGSRQIPKTIGQIPFLPSANSLDTELQTFFDRNLTNGERILNLCQNADVFYKQDFLVSSSRLFVYWPQMTLVPNFIDEMKNSPFDAVITCSLNELNKVNQRDDELKQSLIVNSLINNGSPAAEIEVLGKTWRIYRNS
jgi:hypothetical protein